MNGIASEFAVEILVHFEKRDRNSAPREKKSEYGSARPASGNATGSLLTVDNLSVSSLRLNRIEKLRRQGSSSVGRFHVKLLVLSKQRFEIGRVDSRGPLCQSS